MRTITKEQLNDIANGACFLASGGGGPLSMGLQLIEATFADKPKGEVQVVSVEEASQDTNKLTAMVCYIGAPSSAEDVKKPHAAFNAFDRLNEHCMRYKGKALGYVIPIEIGAVSSIVPCLVALEKGISVIDGDGAGRAVPMLTQTTYASHGVSANPTVVASDEEVVGVLDVETAAQAEELIRPFIGATAFKEHAGLAMWVMDGPTLAEAVPIQGTLELAKDIGSKLKTVDHPASGSPVEDVMALLKENGLYALYLLRTGIFKGIPFAGTTQRGGFDLGRVVLQSDQEMIKRIVTIYYKNESLIAWDNLSDAPIAMAPDSICYLQADGITFSNDPLGKGPNLIEPLCLIGIRARKELRQDSISKNFEAMLANYGFAGRYTPIGSPGSR